MNMSQQPYGLYPPPPPVAPKKPRWPWIAGGIVGLFVVLVVSIGVATNSGQQNPQPGGFNAGVVTSTTASTPPPEVVATSAEPVYDTPVPKDFTLAVNVLNKECFGSAGCDITFRISVTLTGNVTFDPAQTYTVTYDLTGTDGGASQGSFRITGTTVNEDGEDITQTGSSSTQVTAHVTSVLGG